MREVIFHSTKSRLRCCLNRRFVSSLRNDKLLSPLWLLSPLQLLCVYRHVIALRQSNYSAVTHTCDMITGLCMGIWMIINRKNDEYTPTTRRVHWKSSNLLKSLLWSNEPFDSFLPANANSWNVLGWSVATKELPVGSSSTEMEVNNKSPARSITVAEEVVKHT